MIFLEATTKTSVANTGETRHHDKGEKIANLGRSLSSKST